MLPARNNRDFDEIPQGARIGWSSFGLNGLMKAIAKALEKRSTQATAAAQ